MEGLREKFNIVPTEELDILNKFFEENDLEVGEEGEPERTMPLQAFWSLDDKGIAGGVLLADCQGEYILDGIAVREDLRGTRLGEALLIRILREAKERGADKMLLVARAPNFFRKYGFVQIEAKDVPHFFGCMECPQYNKDCFPEIMKKEGLKNEDYC